MTQNAMQAKNSRSFAEQSVFGPSIPSSMDANSNFPSLLILVFSQVLIMIYLTPIVSRPKNKWYKLQKVNKFSFNSQLQTVQILTSDV